MKPTSFAYLRPESLDDALKLNAAGTEGTAFLAGGQSLLPLLGLRVTGVTKVIDIGRLPELRGTGETADSVTIGAGITHAEIEDGLAPDPGDGLMRRMASQIAYRAIRNQGTIGGSVAMADPAADWPVCLIALRATAVIAGRHGERRETVENLMIDTYTTSLDNEALVAFEIPKLAPGAKTGVAKVGRKAGAFALSVAVAIMQDGDRPSRVVLGGAGRRARRLANTGRALQAVADSEALRSAVLRDLAAIEDLDDYAIRLHSTVVLRAIDGAWAR